LGLRNGMRDSKFMGDSSPLAILVAVSSIH
jgi:hypothetical protein